MSTTNLTGLPLGPYPQQPVITSPCAPVYNTTHDCRKGWERCRLSSPKCNNLTLNSNPLSSSYIWKLGCPTWHLFLLCSEVFTNWYASHRPRIAKTNLERPHFVKRMRTKHRGADLMFRTAVVPGKKGVELDGKSCGWTALLLDEIDVKGLPFPRLRKRLGRTRICQRWQKRCLE